MRNREMRSRRVCKRTPGGGLRPGTDDQKSLLPQSIGVLLDRRSVRVEQRVEYCGMATGFKVAISTCRKILYLRFYVLRESE